MGRIPTIYYCPYESCTASYDRKHRFETHIRSHTGERPFICSHEGCGKNFASSSHLKRHEDTHGSSYRCTIAHCPEVLKTKATLKKHIKKVHLKTEKHKIYTCTECGKEFSKHNTLQRHELRHSGQLPYKCSVEGCQKAFLTPSKLKRHVKIHEGYPCKILGCDKVFEKWTLYVQHVRDCHRPEYKCQVCSKVFTKSYALKLHVPLHEESRLVYPCEVPNCSRYYYAERNLKWHMKKYHAKRPFMCDKDNCHRAFKTEADLAEHILYHGKKKPRKKNKPKKSKPSFAAILSGVAEVRQVNRKSNQVLTEEESDVLVSANKLNSTDLELDTTKTSSLGSLEPNQSPVEEENTSVLTNERIVSCVYSKAIPMPNLFESSQSNIFEINQSATAKEFDSVCSAENCVAPMECEINSSSMKLKLHESTVQEYTTIEIVGSGNLSQFITVPVIQMDDKHWNKNVSVHIETIS